jgi:hypothetical protein
MRNAYKMLVRKPEGKRPLGRPRCRWEDNIKMYPKKTEWMDVDWIYLVRYGLMADSCEHINDLQVP